MIKEIIEAIILPPNIFFILFIAVFFMKKILHIKIFIFFNLVFLYFSFMPMLAYKLIIKVESDIDFNNIPNTNSQVIVVLGAGIKYDNDSFILTKSSVSRLKYAVFLHKKNKLPLMLSGGRTNKANFSEAEIMQKYLSNINIQAKWLENNSHNTREQAKYVWQILQPLAIKNIILVTDNYHMKRAMNSFLKIGFDTVIPANVYSVKKITGIQSFIPTAEAMINVRLVLHEYLGIIWYKILDLLGIE